MAYVNQNFSITRSPLNPAAKVFVYKPNTSTTIDSVSASASDSNLSIASNESSLSNNDEPQTDDKKHVKLQEVRLQQQQQPQPPQALRLGVGVAAPPFMAMGELVSGLWMPYMQGYATWAPYPAHQPVEYLHPPPFVQLPPPQHQQLFLQSVQPVEPMLEWAAYVQQAPLQEYEQALDWTLPQQQQPEQQPNDFAFAQPSSGAQLLPQFSVGGSGAIGGGEEPAAGEERSYEDYQQLPQHSEQSSQPGSPLPWRLGNKESQSPIGNGSRYEQLENGSENSSSQPEQAVDAVEGQGEGDAPSHSQQTPPETDLTPPYCVHRQIFYQSTPPGLVYGPAPASPHDTKQQLMPHIFGSIMHIMAEQQRPLTYSEIVHYLSLRLERSQTEIKRYAPSTLYEAVSCGYLRKLCSRYVLLTREEQLERARRQQDRLQRAQTEAAQDNTPLSWRRR